MVEKNNISPLKDFGLRYQPSQSDNPAIMYLDMLRNLQTRYDALQHENSALLSDINRRDAQIELLQRNLDEALQRVTQLNTALEMERAKNISLSKTPFSRPTNTSNDANEIPQRLNNLKKYKPLDKETIDRLLNDSKHYPVVCDKALHYWQLLCNEGFVDQRLRLAPQTGITVAARIACCFQTVVDPNIHWSFFERHWKKQHLQSNLCRSSYRDEKKYPTINRIFGRAENAPFLSKSALID